MGASRRIDRLTYFFICGAETLAAGRAEQGVVVERGNHRDLPASGQQGEVQGEAMEAVQVQHVRLERGQGPVQLVVEQGAAVGVCEGAGNPVVDQLHHGQALEGTPSQRAVGPGWIVVSAQHSHRVPLAQLAAKVESIDLGAGLMSGKEIMNRVEDLQPSLSGAALGEALLGKPLIGCSGQGQRALVRILVLGAAA